MQRSFGGKKGKWKKALVERDGGGDICRGLAAFDEEETIFEAVASFTSLAL